MLNPARIDFVTLRLFCAVARTGSITRGAAQCHLALSAASRRLADFETTTGSPLLERTARGVRLTSTGHVVLQHAARLLQGFELLSNEVADHAGGYRGHVRLWANMSALTEFLPDTLAAFMRQHPDIHVEIEEQLSPDITRALLDGLADIGVFAEGTATDGLKVANYRTDQLVLVCPREHELATHQSIAFDACLDHAFVGLNRGSSLLSLMSRVSAEHNRRLTLRVQVRSFDAMCQMIAAGLGVGVLPEGACRATLAPRGLIAIPLNDAWAQRRLFVAVNPESSLSSAAQALWNELAAPTKAVP
jgi:DNA-binding transcriptional LysR family regulator